MYKWGRELNYVIAPTKDDIKHHGVKGQKWGVRNGPPYPLKNNPGSQFSITNRKLKGESIKLSNHIYEQINKRGLFSAEEILNAYKNPLYVREVKYDEKNRPSIRYIGSKVTININPDNNIVTTAWRTGTKTVKKYKKGQ